MLDRNPKGYLVRTVTEAPCVSCPCGVSTRPLTGADGAPCSLHVTSIRDAARHYHRKSTEVYYILEGTGKIELNGDWHDLAPGTVIWIEPQTRHRVVSDDGLKTIVFALPAFDPADEWFDEPNEPPASACRSQPKLTSHQTTCPDQSGGA